MSPDLPAQRICQIRNYLIQVRTALESKHTDSIEQFVKDFESLQLEIQNNLQYESTDKNSLADLHEEVVSLINMANREKQELDKIMSAMEKRKKNITAYIKNR